MRPFARTADEPPHLSDTRDIRGRAREHLERGAVTEAHPADRDAILQLLNEALATWRFLEDVLAKQEEHTEELASLPADPRALRSPSVRPEPSAAN